MKPSDGILIPALAVGGSFFYGRPLNTGAGRYALSVEAGFRKVVRRRAKAAGMKVRMKRAVVADTDGYLITRVG